MKKKFKDIFKNKMFVIGMILFGAVLIIAILRRLSRLTLMMSRIWP